MDYETIIWIKEEVSNDICSPGPMLLQDPLKIEEPCFDIKGDPEEELNVDSCEHYRLDQPFAFSGSNASIKEEPELNLTDETENLIEVKRPLTITENDLPRVKKEEVSVIVAAHWNHETRIRVISLIEGGCYCPSKAGERCGVPKVTARRWWREYTATGRTRRLGGSGRPRVSSERDDQRLLDNIHANPFLSSRQLAHISEFPCSVRTVRRRLKDNGILCRRGAIKQHLNMYRRIDRMAFAAEYIDFDWSRVIFSDQKIFSSISNAAVQVYRPQREWFTPNYIAKRERSGHYSVATWGYISARGAGPLWQIEGILNAEAYINILQNIMKPSIELLYPQGDVYFLQENIPIHQSIQEWFNKQERIKLMVFVPQSPDLNPIENMWMEVTRSLPVGFSNTSDLWEHIERIWWEVNHHRTLAKQLVESVPKRLKAILSNNGGWASYKKYAFP